MSGEANWLAEHGNDMIPVKLIDLLSVVARLEQAEREGRIEHDASAAERLVTCDLPRLKAYLPDEAHHEPPAPVTMTPGEFGEFTRKHGVRWEPL